MPSFRYYYEFYPMVPNAMKELALPRFQVLDNALNKTSLKLHPSQVHGLVCGILTGHSDGKSHWEEVVTGGKESPKTHEMLQILHDVSQNQLSDFLFEFQLLLPDDEETLPNRAEALTLWCQGFLTGLKLGNVPIVDRSPSDVTEAINDMIEIAKVNYEDVVASEEDETAYVELVEYVRMAVILIYQDIHEGSVVQTQSSSNNHIH